MPRKKSSHPEQLLTHRIRTRVTEAHYERLEKICKNSDCRSVGEVARKILSAEKITVFHKDMTMNATMEELAMIRKELKAIGHNINQQTRYFHTAASPTDKAWYVNRTMRLYEQVDSKVNELLAIVSQLAAKWLPRS